MTNVMGNVGSRQENAVQKIVIVIDGPSGVGKDSVMLGLINKYPNTYQKFANTTTREKRPGEIEGINYHYVTETEFLEALKNKEVYEHTYRFGNYYGMSKKAISNVWAKGKIPINNCDIIGIRETKKLYGKNCLTVFIKASRADVEARLTSRGDDSEKRQERLAAYEEYMSRESEFDFAVENKNLDKAVDELHDFIVNYL